MKFTITFNSQCEHKILKHTRCHTSSVSCRDTAVAGGDAGVWQTAAAMARGGGVLLLLRWHGLKIHTMVIWVVKIIYGAKRIHSASLYMCGILSTESVFIYYSFDCMLTIIYQKFFNWFKGPLKVAYFWFLYFLLINQINCAYV